MKKIYLQFIVIFLILLIGILLIFIPFYDLGIGSQGENESFKNTSMSPIKNLEIGNGIITNIWIDEKRIDNLKNHNIKYLFVDVGDTRLDGKIETSENEIKNFLRLIENYEKKNNYDFILLPYNEIILNDYDFSSLTFRENIIENHVSLMELGFDGAHIDIEAIPFDQRKEYLNFLEEISNNIGEEKMLTVYVGALSDEPNEWEWEPEFYSAVSDRVDIISMQGYDFHKTSKKAYQEYLTKQIKKIADKKWNSKFLFTAPTHKIYPETLETALDAYTKEISKHKTNQFIGIAIFAEWTTDDDEWKVFENYLNENQ